MSTRPTIIEPSRHRTLRNPNFVPSLFLHATMTNSKAMKVHELLSCQIQEWYPRFKAFSIKTIILPIPPPFLSYLLSDDGPVLLPSSSPSPPNLHSDDPSPTPPSFPDFDSEVSAAISALGGAVFPKLNWSSPKDAAALSFSSSLNCSSLPDIALLLKSSDAISHDLSHALPSCSDFQSSQHSSVPFHLALRKWYPSLRPEMELRCFVRRLLLLAVSQREVTTFYPALVDALPQLRVLVEEFFEGVVLPKFELEDFTFDVYVTRDRGVKVVDFNPWGVYTLPLLFEWEELEGMLENGAEEVEFRVVESRRGVRPGLKTVVPYDYVDTGQRSGWEEFFRKAEEELRRQQVRYPQEGD